MKQMSTSVSDFNETDLDIRFAKKNMKQMSTSISDFNEMDLDIRFAKQQKKNTLNGCRHPFQTFMKRISTSVLVTFIEKKFDFRSSY